MRRFEVREFRPRKLAQLALVGSCAFVENNKGVRRLAPFFMFTRGGRSGCAPSVSVAAALMLAPVERIACSIFFSVVVNGSYETCSAPFAIFVSITPSKA